MKETDDGIEDDYKEDIKNLTDASKLILEEPMISGKVVYYFNESQLDQLVKEMPCWAKWRTGPTTMEWEE